MKKILLIPSNTDLNRGDEALVWESIELIKDIYNNDVSISIIGSTEKTEEAFLQTRQTKKLGYDICETLLKHPSRNNNNEEVIYSIKTYIKWGIIAIKDLFFSLLLLSKKKLFFNTGYAYLDNEQKKTYSLIKNADAIFVKGGGFLHSYGSIADGYKIYYFLYLIMLSQKLGKDVYILPNSIGPLKNIIARYISKKVLNKCKIVTTRESISQKYMKSIGLNTYRFPDLGFYLKPSSTDFRQYLTQKQVNLDKINILFTLRPYRFEGSNNPTELYQNYENCIISTIKYLISNNYCVTLFAHTLGPGSHEDDRKAIRSVYDKLPNNIRNNVVYISDPELTCREVEKIYSYYDFVIGTRFHSVIFSLNVNVPAIAIAYGGNKGKGIMEDLKENNYIVEMDKLNNNILIEKINKLIINRDIYIDNLRKNRIEIDKKRDELIALIKNNIENINSTNK